MNFIPASRLIHLGLAPCPAPLLLRVLASRRVALLSCLTLLVLTASRAISGATVEAHESAAVANKPASVLRVKLVLEKDSPVMEIVSSRPLRPLIRKTQNPPGVRIDLNNAQMSIRHRQIAVQSPLIDAIQLDQFGRSPPVVRIVVTELMPLSYTWDAAGNRLSIRLHRESDEAKARPPSVAALTRDPEPVAVPVSPSRTLVFADQQASGSSFSAGFNTETLRLARGGEVHVCPGTTVSILHPQNGPDLMLAMGVGAMETHYVLENSSDTILTPDFRILLRGPGEFHYAIRADPQGNTCVRALPGNTAPVVVYETMGNGQFEVVPSEKLIFHAGHLNPADTAFHTEHLTQVETVVPDDCGCPAPIPVMRAELPATPAEPENNEPSEPIAPQSRVELTSAKPLVPKSVSTKLESVVDFEARLAFAQEEAPPTLADLPLLKREIPFPEAGVVPPASTVSGNKRSQKGALRKLSGFFSRIFR